MEPEVIFSNDDMEFVILASEPQLTLTRGRFAPGQRPAGRHVHHEHVDSFYVLEGTFTFEVGPDAERVVVEAGGSIAIRPRWANLVISGASTTQKPLICSPYSERRGRDSNPRYGEAAQRFSRTTCARGKPHEQAELEHARARRESRWESLTAQLVLLLTVSPPSQHQDHRARDRRSMAACGLISPACRRILRFAVPRG